jgi:acetyl-CoA acyltransferase
MVEAVRTPLGRGRDGGSLNTLHPVDLLAQVLEALCARLGLDPSAVDDVIVGCVTQACEQAMNPGRTAVLAAGFPEHVPATTIDRQCGGRYGLQTMCEADGIANALLVEYLGTDG